MTSKNTHSFYLSDSTYKKLGEYAKQRDVSKSAILKILINQYCKGDKI